MLSSEMNILKTFFERNSITVSIYWLECCLQWFKEQHPQYNETFMCNEVLSQWLESDLREIEHATLPNDINKHKKHTLNDNYAVQLMYVKDISKSAYSQLKELRNMFKLTRHEIDPDATQTSGDGKRTLYLFLTDGVQYINAFEYQYIHCISTDIKPGTKLLLMGPLQIRNGEILLKANNLKILGGFVEDLLISNAYENVLAREVNLPENPQPGQLICEQIQHPVVQQTPQSTTIDDDDHIFQNLDIPEHFDDSVFQQNDIFEESIDVDIPEEVFEQEITAPPIINETKDPFVYIKHLKDNSHHILNKVYKVKAEFFRVVEKLNVSKSRGWNMKFEIMDGTGTITVDFLSSVIEKLMDLTPQEAIAENQKVKNKICDSHEKVSEALKNCKRKLDSFQYIMHLQFNDIDRPTVIALETLTNEHFIQLKNRVDYTELKIF